MRNFAATLGMLGALNAFTAMAASEPAKPDPAATSQAPAPAAAPLPPVPPGYGAKKTTPEKPAKMVDLNNASKAELMTLPSVGEAEAAKIIANRPYVSKTDLVTKAGLPEGVYVAVRHKVVVNNLKKKPAAQNAAPQK